jgi:hypothetical protein
MAQTQRLSDEIQTVREKEVIAVLDPRGQPVGTIKALTLAPRPKTLDGKTVYLVDVGFGGGYEFLDAMRGWFAEKMPSVKTVLKRKVGNMLLDNPDLWAEIKDQGHAVIFGVGG